MPESPATRPWTYDEYLLLPDDGRRWQIIGGERFVTPAPRVRHQRVIGRLYALLVSDRLVTSRGEVLLSPVDLVLSSTDVVQPDLLFVSKERASIVHEKALHGPPDLVIEVLSPSTARIDRVLKRRLYEESGVDELWLVDLDAETVEVHRVAGGGYGAPELLPAGAVLTTPVLPGVELDIAGVFDEEPQPE